MPRRPIGSCAPRRARAFSRTSMLAVAFALGAAALLPDEADAQYFGRNKVQYQQFDWSIFDTEHFDVYFYPAESLATLDMSRAAERWYQRLSRQMSFTFEKRSLIFYANQPDFQQTNVIDDFLNEGTGGVTEGLRERVIMPHTGSYQATNHVLGHELVHVYQYGIANGTEGGLRNLSRIPLWMIEGMAEYLSVGQRDPHTAMWLRDALLRDDIPTLDQLTRDPRYFPYRYGQAFWAYVGGRFGDAAVPDIYREALRAGPEAALRRVLGRPVDSLSMEWHDQIRRDYGPLLVGRTAPDSIGIPVITQGRRDGDQNISPVVSPDGRTVAFFSSRALFGFSLYIADAETGDNARELTNITSDAHFDALTSLQSGASFSPDGSKLAFVVQAGGLQEIDVLDVASRDIERRIQIEGIGAISDPAWSPDGNAIAFSGNTGGISDLYLTDLQSGQTRALTSGRNAELHPAWSPDGRTIAFTTDRGPETNFGLLTFGPMRVGLLDVASGQVELLPSFPDAKVINPQFSPDGQDLFFISDRDGFSDVYRLSLATRQLYRVTEVATGISGITALSPALSVAAQTGRMLFSVFSEAGYSIRRLEASETQGTPVEPTIAPSLAGLLPPIEVTRPSAVETYLADATTGLPAATLFPVKPYNSSFALDYIGVPGAGVSFGGPLGTGVAGGVAAIWGDQLSNRLFGTVAQVNGTVKDFGGQLFYTNRERRWNWGASAGRSPFLGIFAQSGQVVEDGQVFDVFDQVIQRQYLDDASVFIQYPFSTTRRIEFATGFQRISSDLEVERLFIVGGRVVGRERIQQGGPPALNLGQASVAFVGDYSFFGLNGPIAGGRYRFEVAPTLGSLNFQTALADYRRYFYPRPFTFAIRGLHYGRYGKDSDEFQQLRPLSLGNPFFMRGYETFTFDAAVECTPTTGTDPFLGGGNCAQLTRLSGSRIAIVSAEFRIPLLGPRQLALFNVPFLPTDISPFVDAGVAWTKNESPDFRFDRTTVDRVPVVSAGVSTRFNLLGFAVAEIYYVYPFQRPEKGGYFTFQLAPAW